MRNVLGKIVEKIKTCILCSTTFFFFRKSCRLWECRKIWCSKRGHRWRYNMVLTSCMLDKKATCAHAHVHAHARQAHARTRAHTQICNIYCFSTAKMIRELASVLRYTRWFKYDRDWLCVNKSQFVPVIFEPPCTYIVCLVFIIFLGRYTLCSCVR